jgi:Uncharacterised nucleotidyltransferase
MKFEWIEESLSAEQQIRHAVLLTFCDPPPAECSLLRHISHKDWKKLLHWLDTSGLALYFLDRMLELQRSEMLPPSVLERLQQNLHDNIARTERMAAESNTIHREFQRSHLSYATLKGFSLWPLSAPKPWLRSQLDLDFLVAEHHVPEASRILEQRGYYLHAVSGKTWEFKTAHAPSRSVKDLYKPLPLRCVELHAETTDQARPSVLARQQELDFNDVSIPVLSRSDLFVGQALHLFKHVASEFSRTAHLVEFYRHVLARRHDDLFWKEVQAAAEENPRASLALGVITMLTTQVMGNFAPETLTNWTVHHVPAPVRSWVRLYGCRSVLCSFPGSKLYLLLQRELEREGMPSRRSLRQSLLPRGLPPAIAHIPVDEKVPERIRRYSIQVRFVCFRLRFHVFEGLRYLCESFKWRRRARRLAL